MLDWTPGSRFFCSQIKFGAVCFGFRTRRTNPAAKKNKKRVLVNRAVKLSTIASKFPSSSRPPWDIFLQISLEGVWECEQNGSLGSRYAVECAESLKSGSFRPRLKLQNVIALRYDTWWMIRKVRNRWFGLIFTGCQSFSCVPGD